MPPLRLAHTLKGAAANIGARDLQNSAQVLETACKNKASEEEIAVLLESVENQLAPVLEGLAVLDPPSDQVPSESGSGTAASSVSETQLEQLRGLLEDYDSQAVDLVEELLNKQLSERSRQLLTRILARISHRDPKFWGKLAKQVGRSTAES